MSHRREWVVPPSGGGTTRATSQAPRTARSGGRIRSYCEALLRDLAGQIGGGPAAGVRPAPPVPLRVLFRRFWPYARPQWPLIAAALACAVLSSLLAALSIGLFKVLVDRVLVPRDLSAFGWVALTYTMVALLAGAIGFGRRMLGTLAGERFVLTLRRSVFEHLQVLSLAFFEQRRLGDVLRRLTGDVKSIERLVVSGVFRAVSYVLRIVFFTAALFALQWRLALLTVAVIPLFAALARHFSRKLKQATREQTRRSGALTAVLEESLANLPLVQAYSRQHTEAARLDEQDVARFRARMAATRLRALFTPLVDLVELFGTLIVAGAGTLLLARGNLTLGGLLAFAAYLTQLYRPVRRLGKLANTAYSASAGAERILELLDAQPTVTDNPFARTLCGARGQLRFERVSFTYPDSTRPALQDISFTVEPGQVVAIVGASGAGKSTAAKLLLRFYDPTSGGIFLDGHALPELTLASLRAQMAVLLQDALVFDATIGDNIAYGRPGATRDQLVRAARAADVHEFATAMPDGYDTVIGQRGRRLSGGQRQRLAIARAMIRDTPLLVLDEPTAGLDAAATRRVLDPLRRLMADRATVLISHNLTAARDADTILVLDQGRLVEHGDHQTLLANHGAYHRLYTAHTRNPGEVTLT